MKQEKQLTKPEAFYLWGRMEAKDKTTIRIMGKLYRIFGGSRGKLYKDWAKTVK